MARTGMSEAAKKRVKAGRMLLAGKGCAEVALAVGVGRQTVYTWKKLLDEGGIDTLREVPERGRPAQLGAQRADTHHPVSFQLEPRLGHRRPHAHQLPVSLARGQHQEVRGPRVPKDIGGARDLAMRDKYQFYWWACSLVNAQPYQRKKKGADGGCRWPDLFSGRSCWTQEDRGVT